MNFMMLLKLICLRWAAVTSKGLEIKRNVVCYKREFIAYITYTIRILAPAVYTFLTILLPVIAFGEKLSRDTDGRLGVAHTLTSAAICGIIHSVLNGQPFIVPGVSQPTILLYTYMYKYAIGRQDLGEKLFLAWAAWICTWTTMLLLGMGFTTTCTINKKFTAIAGDAFGGLVFVLFLKQAIKGLVSEFTAPISEDPTYSLLLLFLLAFLFTAYKRSCLSGQGYGLPFMVLVCITASLLYVPTRTLSSPMFGEGFGALYQPSIIKDMGQIPPIYIVVAFIPAAMIAGLYFFEHTVASQATRDPYTLYDLLLLGFLTLMCGLVGLPPSGCVLRRSKCVDIIKNKVIRLTMVGGFETDDYSLIASETVKEMRDPNGTSQEDEGGDVDSLVTALLLGACLWIIPLKKLIPTSVLWGYFVYMAVDSLPGYRFWERLVLVFTPSGGRHTFDCVPYRTIVRFTVFQIVYFLTYFSMAWVPIPDIFFPVPFFIMSAVRQHVLPRFFHPYHLIKLDEEIGNCCFSEDLFQGQMMTSDG